MKAAVYKKYGGPEVVSIQEVPMPIAAPNELLIQVHATTVNRTDTGFRSAEYVISRFWSGLLKPKQPILGSEFAGVVHAVGSDVTSFQVGDRVFGFNDKTFGGNAEYLTISQDGPVALIPENIDFIHAAALTEGSHYALVDIRAAKVQPGQNVMVYGATGSIGSAAVQLLKHFGAQVTAVCNTKNIDLVHGLGADKVIDYEKEDFTQCAIRFDLIFDAVGKSSFGQCKPLLTKKGIYISTELGKNAQNVWLALLTPLFGGKKILFPIPSMTKADALYLADLAKNKLFTPVIDSVRSLDEIVAIHAYVGSGQKTGNVVIAINH